MNDQDSKEVLLKRIAELENEIHIREGDLIHDSLTGIKTRTFLEEELDIYIREISNAGASRRKQWFGFKNLSLLFIDIDNFKMINDTYGHPTGDAVLKEVAMAINQSVREGDTVARWGGEEIVVMLLGANEADAKEKAENIRKKIDKLNISSIQEHKVTLSIGVATLENGLTFKDLVTRSDKAMYKAKESGRNKVVTYSDLG